MPKAVVGSIEDVPEALRPEYVRQDDGTYVLKVEGALPNFVPRAEFEEQKRRLAEFRDNGRTVMSAIGATSVEEAVKKVEAFKGLTAEQIERLRKVDPDEYDKLKAAQKALEGAGITNPNDLQTQIQRAIGDYGKAVVEPLKAQLDEQISARKRAEEMAAKQAFDKAIADKALEVGADPKMIDFVLFEAGKVFEPKDGSVKAKDGQFSKDKPGDALSVEEWLGSLMKEKPGAFKRSGGSGGGGRDPNSGVKGDTLVNPTPAELGRHASAIAKGTMKVQNTR